MQCATHPDVETELGCSRCGKAICARCLVHTPVGARCRECANVRRIPTYNTSPSVLWRAAAAAVAAGLALGLAWGIFNPLTYFFFGVIMGLAVGYGIGELVSLATNRRAGPPLQAMAVGGVAIAYAVRTLFLFTVGDWVFDDLRVDLGGLIAVTLAAFIAAGRLR
jgi:hypothetical protein